jgi:hypothetical protein
VCTSKIGVSLAKTILGGREQSTAVLGYQQGNDGLAFFKVHAAYAGSVVAHRRIVVLVEA